MRYFIGFLMSVGLIVLVFVLVLHDFSSPKPVGPPLANLAGTSTTMQLTEQGPLVADQNFQGYRITVGNSQSQIQTLQGYQQQVTQTKVYESNQQAFAQFLRALDFAGFQKGSKDQSKSDSRGYCASGDRYDLEIVSSDGSDTEHFWKTSCGQGSYGGNLSQTLLLFRQQIPDYDSVAGSLNL